MYVDREFNIRVDKSNFPIIKNSIHHLALDANISFYNYSKNKKSRNTTIYDYKNADFNAIGVYLSSVTENIKVQQKLKENNSADLNARQPLADSQNYSSYEKRPKHNRRYSR